MFSNNAEAVVGVAPWLLKRCRIAYKTKCLLAHKKLTAIFSIILSCETLNKVRAKAMTTFLFLSLLVTQLLSHPQTDE
jgi:hypothetical protein